MDNIKIPSGASSPEAQKFSEVVSGKAVTFKEHQNLLDPAVLTRDQSNKSAMLA